MANLESSKFLGYAVVGSPPAKLDATKFLGYAVEGAGNAGTLTSTKFIAYGVLSSPGPETQRIRVRLVARPMAP